MLRLSGPAIPERFRPLRGSCAVTRSAVIDPSLRRRQRLPVLLTVFRALAPTRANTSPRSSFRGTASRRPSFAGVCSLSMNPVRPTPASSPPVPSSTKAHPRPGRGHRPHHRRRGRCRPRRRPPPHLRPDRHPLPPLVRRTRDAPGPRRGRHRLHRPGGCGPDLRPLSVHRRPARRHHNPPRHAPRPRIHLRPPARRPRRGPQRRQIHPIQRPPRPPPGRHQPRGRHHPRCAQRNPRPLPRPSGDSAHLAGFHANFNCATGGLPASAHETVPDMRPSISAIPIPLRQPPRPDLLDCDPTARFAALPPSSATIIRVRTKADLSIAPTRPPT